MSVTRARWTCPPWQPPPCNIGDVAAALKDTDEQCGYRAAVLSASVS